MASEDLSFSLSINLKQALADVDRFVSDAQRKFDTLAPLPNRKASDGTDASAARRNRDVIDEQTRQNRLYEIQANAAYRIEQIELSSGNRLSAQRQQTENRITSIAQNAGNKRVSDVNREVNTEIAAFNRLSRAAPQAIGGEAANRKSLQYVFQAQQAVEDFSYAGLRGASNNVAFMASQLGGPAGLIALLGITAIQLGPLIAGFDSASASTERFNGFIESVNSTLTEFATVKPSDIFDEARVDNVIQKYKEMEKSVRSLKREMQAQSMSGDNLQAARRQLGFVQKAREDRQATGDGQQIADLDRVVDQAKQNIKTMFPNWQGDLRTLEEIKKTIAEFDGAINANFNGWHKNSKELEMQLAHLQKMAEKVEQVNKLRAEFGLAPNQEFQAFSKEESVPEKVRTRRMQADLDHWKGFAEDAIKRNDATTARDATAKANELAEDIQQYKNVVDAVKKAEREQLDQARDALRVQKEKNREKESELKTQEQLVKAINKEQTAQRHTASMSDMDTRQGMSNNAISKMKERDEAMIGMSPNQDWQKIMKAQLDQYYNNVQAASDRFYAREKNNQLAAKANAAQASGDPKDSRKYLEDLQAHQQQQAQNARTPQEANFWYKKSLETQKLIEESFAKQKEQEQAKLESIKNQIKSVEDLEKRVEELSDKIRDVPLLDLQNPAVMQYLDQVDQKLSDMVKKMNQLKGGGGGSDGPAGSDPFGGGMNWGDGKWGGSVGGGEKTIPWGGAWGDPAYSGGLNNNWSGIGDDGMLGRTPNAVGTSPVGGWGTPIGGGNIPGGGPVGGWGAMVDARTSSQSLAHMTSGLPQAIGGGNYGSQINNRNVSIGNMPVSIHGGSSFDVNAVVESARRASANNLLRRGA